MTKIKIVFMGTPAFCVPLLISLIENYEVVGVVTKPDHIVGSKPQYTPVKKIATQYQIKVWQPTVISTIIPDMKALKPDLIITCAYGKLLPGTLLSIPRLGCFNVHASLLPKLRGGAPIHWAIIRGYEKTGITIMKMSTLMDEGDIITQQVINIETTDNVGSLHDRLSYCARDLLLETIPNLISGNFKVIKQDAVQATYAYNIKREDERLNFNALPKDVFNQIRGLDPWPGGYAYLEDKIIKIWQARLGSNYYSDEVINGKIIKIYEDGIGVKVKGGEIIITELQIAGKKRVLARDYINGLQNKELLLGKVFL